MDIQRRTGPRSVVVSFLTATVSERAPLLRENIASVDGLKDHCWEHLILEDDRRRGTWETVNFLAAEAQGEWLVEHDDDDLLLRDFIWRHFDASKEADIVYSPPVVIGESEGTFHGQPPDIPSCSLIRKSLWQELGGFRRMPEREDNDFYRRAVQAGARFVRVDEPCWVYRLHHIYGNKSRGAFR